MQFIIGLGNPGGEYENTRHNIGFEVIDALCERLNTRLFTGRGEYLISFTTYQGKKVGLVKPITFMNNCGLAALDIVERFKAQTENILVICDDFELPLGQIRIRQRGSDGGHNGLYSIIYHLKKQNFARIRCGIGVPTLPRKNFDKSQFVLSQFGENEKPIVQQMVSNARNASLTFISEGITAAMNKYNAKKKE